MDRSASAEDLTSVEYEALAEFRYQIRRFLRFSEGAAIAAGLEPRQHQFLLALKALDAKRQVTISALAERLQLRHHSVVELIDRLVAHKYIERRRGEQDRRQVYIHLTAKGEATLRRLSLHHRDELESTAPALLRALNALYSRTKGTAQ